MEGSSISSPLDSPEVPITSSVATLQSADSLNLKRQVRLSSGHCKEPLVEYPITNVSNTETNTTSCQYLTQNTSKYPNHNTNGINNNALPHSVSFSQTPDTPSANLSSSSPENSQAFSSHFVSQSSLYQIKNDEEKEASPSAALTPSTDFSLEADALNSEDIDLLRFDEDPWDFTNLECLSLDDYFKSSKSSS